VSDIKTN